MQNAMQAQRVAKCKLCMPHMYIYTLLARNTHGENENESEIENSKRSDFCAMYACLSCVRMCMSAGCIHTVHSVYTETFVVFCDAFALK